MRKKACFSVTGGHIDDPAGPEGGKPTSSEAQATALQLTVVVLRCEEQDGKTEEVYIVTFRPPGFVRRQCKVGEMEELEGCIIAVGYPRR